MNNQTPIRVQLVDDQRLIRDGLRVLLEFEPDLKIVAESNNGVEAPADYAARMPDIVLMDIRMPQANGVEATQQIIAAHPDARIIILTTFDEDDFVFQAIQAGARGYLLKDTSGAEIAAAIRTVMAGGSLMTPSITRKVMQAIATNAINQSPSQSGNQSEIDPLSDRELEILSHIADGLNNRQIAQRLHLAEGTVKNYVSTILQKLNVRDRTQAALVARERNLI